MRIFGSCPIATRDHRVVVVGAGIGGLVAALDLARAGCDVLVVERAPVPGGKIRGTDIAGRIIDAGPNVFTMRWVFEKIFADAGTSLDTHLSLEAADTLARHAWAAGGRLNLYADVNKSAEAIGDFAGAAEAKGYLAFCERARATYSTLEKPFILSEQPSPLSLTMGAGLRGFSDLWKISPFVTLWRALGEHFHDPRLRQLFARYATYCGSSPFDAPATLMLVAHVESEGVWLVEGGMRRVAEAVADVATERGARFRYSETVSRILVDENRAIGIELTTGERINCDSVVLNADAAALATGLFGQPPARAVDKQRGTRSLSAVTWAMLAATDGFPLSRHNVFFSDDYAAEFDNIFRRNRLPADPTVYICAQDRNSGGDCQARGAERLLALVNAPAIGDTSSFQSAEIKQCQERAFSLLERCGLTIQATPETTVTTTPADFARLYPGTGGALYGQASHGWTASFTRPTAKTKIPGLYLAGGSTHPGPGVPMAALSGRLAASRVLSDLISPNRSR